MASTYSNLKIQLMVTGENSTTWGTVTNINLGTALEEAIVGSTDVTFANTTVTLTLADTNASQPARNLRLRCTGTTGGSTRNLVVPSIEKPYIVQNDCADSIVIKTSAGAGITVPAGKTMWVYNTGADVVDATTHLTSLTLGTALPISSGGTGSTSGNASALTGLNASNVASGVLAVSFGGTGSNTGNASALTGFNASNVASGVLAVSFGGTGSNTGNASALTSLNASNVASGILAVSFGGTGANTLTGVLKGNGTSSLSAATAGTDYVAPGTASNFTATQTFSGSSSTAATKLINATEKATISGSGASSTIAIYPSTQSILYYTGNASGNWTTNLTWSAGTSMNTALAVSDVVTVVFMATQGASAFYNNVVQVDGTTSGVTTKWQFAVPSAGNANSIDVYTYTVTKTGSGTFTVLASQTKFA